MPKLSQLGSSAIDCRPLPIIKTPAYDGNTRTAGYGDSRRQLVKLALPKINGKMQGQTITLFGGAIKDRYLQTEVAALAGLGCAATPLDRHLAAIFSAGGADFYTDRKGKKVYTNTHSGAGSTHGLGSSMTLPPGYFAQQTKVQEFADAIAKNAVPSSLLSEIHDKLVADEKANAAAYANIATLKTIDPTNPNIARLQAAQQTAWGQTNSAKFYALLIPEMQSRLGFPNSPHVSPPDYKYIKSGADDGVFSRVASYLRDKVIGDAAQNLISAKYMKDSSLAGLGAIQFILPALIAVVVAGALIAYLADAAARKVEAESKAAIAATCATGKLSKAACTAALQVSAGTDFGSIAMYGAIGIGGLVLLQVISSIRSAFPTR